MLEYVLLLSMLVAASFAVISVGVVAGKQLHDVEFVGSPRSPTPGSASATAAVVASPPTIAPRATGRLAVQPRAEAISRMAGHTATRPTPAAVRSAIAAAAVMLAADLVSIVEEGYRRMRARRVARQASAVSRRAEQVLLAQDLVLFADDVAHGVSWARTTMARPNRLTRDLDAG